MLVLVFQLLEIKSLLMMNQYRHSFWWRNAYRALAARLRSGICRDWLCRLRFRLESMPQTNQTNTAVLSWNWGRGLGTCVSFWTSKDLSNFSSSILTVVQYRTCSMAFGRPPTIPNSYLVQDLPLNVELETLEENSSEDLLNFESLLPCDSTAVVYIQSM